MVIDRSYGTNLIESMMIDLCRIERDFDDVYNATLDEETGKLISGPRIKIYEGKCLISRILTKDIEIIDGEMPKYVDNAKMLIPYQDGVDIALGDYVAITKSTNDPRAEQTQFRVYSVEVFSHSVYRRIILRSVIDQLGSTRGAE